MAMPVVFVHFTSAEEVMSSLRLFVCLFVCLLAGLRKNYSTQNSAERFQKGLGKNLQILVVIRITIR